MIAAGWSPSVRLFEAAACGVPVISDAWDGIDTLLTPDVEIRLAGGSEDIIDILQFDTIDASAIGKAARARILAYRCPSRRRAGAVDHGRAGPKDEEQGE